MAVLTAVSEAAWVCVVPTTPHDPLVALLPVLCMCRAAAQNRQTSSRECRTISAARELRDVLTSRRGNNAPGLVTGQKSDRGRGNIRFYYVAACQWNDIDGLKGRYKKPLGNEHDMGLFRGQTCFQFLFLVR